MPQSTPPPTISTLLRLVPDSPSSVLSALRTHPSLASAADQNGYTLLHAAASYNALPLLRELVHTYNCNVNIADDEWETPLFAAETVDAARCLVEELGADVEVLNGEGTGVLENARENLEEGGEWVGVVEYLAGVLEARKRVGNGNENGGDREGAVLSSDGTSSSTGTNGSVHGHAPPPLPDGVRITGMRQVAEEEQEGEAPAPDPEFRRRIEELAAREDFQSEEGQRELKTLVEDAVGGLRGTDERDVRRRT